MTQEFTIPGGAEKGTPIDRASAGALTYWIDRCSKNLRDGNVRNPNREKAFVVAMQAALAAKGGASGRSDQREARTTRRQAPASDEHEAQRDADRHRESALALRQQTTELTGSWVQPNAVLETIRRARAVAHVVSPQPSCSSILDGCAVASSVVLVDIEDETYNVNGKRGLDKTALERIASAAGLDWDPIQSTRLDDATDPYYVHFRAVGRIRNFDGSWVTKVGHVELDLRDGSQDATDMQPKELRVARKFILRLAESKAKNRAIRSLGVRTQYRADDLEKPFVVLRLVFTGQSDDPEIKRYLMSRIADQFLTSSTAMYGGGGAKPLPAGGHAPPAIGEGEGDDTDPDDPADDEMHDDEDVRDERDDDPEDDDFPDSYGDPRAPRQQTLKT